MLCRILQAGWMSTHGVVQTVSNITGIIRWWVSRIPARQELFRGSPSGRAGSTSYSHSTTAALPRKGGLDQTLIRPWHYLCSLMHSSQELEGHQYISCATIPSQIHPRCETTQGRQLPARVMQEGLENNAELMVDKDSDNQRIETG